MLPFLQPKKMVSVMIAKHKPDGGLEPSHEAGEHPPELMAAAEDLISAVHSKDAKAVASALQAAFEICDSMPHEEGDHLEDESEEQE